MPDRKNPKFEVREFRGRCYVSRVVNKAKTLNNTIKFRWKMAHQDPRVSRLLEQIQRLINGEPITIGGPFDVSNLREQIAQLQTDSALPQEAMSSLVELLSKVDPGLSTWEARKNRQPIKVRAAYRFLKEDYVSWFRIEEEVIDTIGLEVIGVSEILFSNYCGSGPFIARLPDSVTPAQLEDWLD